MRDFVVNIASLLLSACQPASPATTAPQNNSSSYGQATGLPSKIKIGWIDSMTGRLATGSEMDWHGAELADKQCPALI
jgi:hypothetical protein